MLNFTAIDEFWKLVNLLKKDQPLTDELWNKFYSIEANKEYASKNISDDDLFQYKNSLEIVFRPSYKNLLQEEINAKNEWVIKTNRYREYEEELKEYCKILKSKDYASLMHEQAYRQLPTSMQQPCKDLKIYIIPIGADAAAHDTTIYLSLHILYFFDKHNEAAIAGHELHHVLREDFKSKKPIEEKHEGVIYFLESIQNEGVADLIDKKIVIDHNDQLPSELQWKSALIMHNEDVIQKIDQMLKNAHLSNDTNTISEDDVRNLIMHTSGHVPGFYMATIITKQLYHTEMIENISNPFHFFKLYNTAAIKETTAPQFSIESIKYIEQLENYYN